MVKFTVIKAGSLFLFACNSGNEGQEFPQTQHSDSLETPYSVWISDAETTAKAFGDILRDDAAAGDNQCAKDSNKPKGYSTHFSIISTHLRDRVDVIKQYNIDETRPALYGDTRKLLTPNIGEFLHQTGEVPLKDREAHETIRLTFSKLGKFTGYCDDTFGYTVIINVDEANEKMASYATSCNAPAHIVCMSIR